MKDQEMSIIERIRSSPDPEKAMQIAVDIVSRVLAGESMESIAASYGVELEGIKA